MMGFLFRFASPQAFYRLAAQMIPWFSALAFVLMLAGLWIGFALAPTDAQQGEGYRIIFLHVPASWMSMVIFMAMAFWSFLGLTFKTRLSGMMTAALAPSGAIFAFLSLWTGAMWGKPMWGAWWVWDARLTSELILLLLYLGYIALTQAIDNPTRRDKAGSIWALVGSINVPIIYYSVVWWNSLHQGASVSMTSAPHMARLMLWGMLLMAIAFWMYAVVVALYRVRSLILIRERETAWVQALFEVSGEVRADT
jgi:heme exporter protein C